MAQKSRNPEPISRLVGWPLGNRSAAGEFVQRGTGIGGTGDNTDRPVYTCGNTVTFAVAFANAPLVWLGGQTASGHISGGCYSITESTFAPSIWTILNSSPSTVRWVALGS
jgi:hypothetical protein